MTTVKKLESRSEAEGLRCCPFCGREAWVMRSGKIHFVECKRCMATGPEAAKPGEAIDRWNDRLADKLMRGSK